MRDQHLQLRQLHQPLIRRLLLLGLIGLLGGCAKTAVLSAGSTGLPERAELTEVPFFPQQDYQCGPAALATMLNQRGIAADPDRLVDHVYIPARQGSLQVEMIAATRGHGLLAYPLQPTLESLLTEVAADNPVLVLQNLAFDRWPQWHFAVVVGYDLASQQIILRSGTTERHVESFWRFLRSWHKGDRWAVVTLPPDKLPEQAEEARWLQAASDLEQTGRAAAARKAYETAATHWRSGLSWFALANARYAGGDRRGAEDALRMSVERDASFAPGWFNLSQVLAERACPSEAAQALACARQVAPGDQRFAGKLPQGVETSECRAIPACGPN